MLVWAAQNVSKRWSQCSNWKMIGNCCSDVRIGHFKPLFLFLPLREVMCLQLGTFQNFSTSAKQVIVVQGFFFSPFIFHLDKTSSFQVGKSGKYFSMCNVRAPFFLIFQINKKQEENKEMFILKKTLLLVLVGFIAQLVYNQNNCLLVNLSRPFSFNHELIGKRLRNAAAHVTQWHSSVHFLFPEHIVACEVILAD